jgi:hypothetical protein
MVQTRHENGKANSKRASQNGKHEPEDPHFENDLNERCLLCCMLRDNACVASLGITAEDFRVASNQLVFRAIRDLLASGRPATLDAIGNLLLDRRQVEYVRYTYLADLWTATQAFDMPVSFSRLVREQSLRRQLVMNAGEILRAAQEGKPLLDLCNDLGEEQARLQALAEGSTSTDAFDFGWKNFDEFMAADHRLTWAIEEMMVLKQPMFVGGPSKSLKTLIGLDAVISLASGTSFLGKYVVPERQRCLVLSGEISEATLKDAMASMCRGRGLCTDTLKDWIIIGSNMPKITNDAHMTSLRQSIERFKADVLMLDPTYLCLMNGTVEVTASNYMMMGELLYRFSRVCLDAGCTPMLFTHFKMTTPFAKEPGLEDIAYAGFQQFARQWMLVSRRSTFDPTPATQWNEMVNELWFVSGGSSVPGKRLALDVYEGIRDREFQGYSWRVDVSNVTDAKQHKAGQAMEDKFEADTKKQEAKNRHDENAVLKVIDDYATNHQPLTRRKVSEVIGARWDSVAGAVERLLHRNILELYEAEAQFGGRKRKVTALRRRKTEC